MTQRQSYRGTSYRTAADAPENLLAQAAATRQALIAFATERFNLSGFRNVTIEEVVRGCGMSKPTLYHYFRSKETLIIACLEADRDQHSAGAALTVGDAGPDPADRIRAMVRYYTGQVSATDGCNTLMAIAALEFPNPDTPVRIAAMEFARLLRDRLKTLARPIAGSQARQ